VIIKTINKGRREYYAIQVLFTARLSESQGDRAH
jgi:hypothetical protein